MRVILSSVVIMYAMDGVNDMTWKVLENVMRTCCIKILIQKIEGGTKKRCVPLCIIIHVPLFESLGHMTCKLYIT